MAQTYMVGPVFYFMTASEARLYMDRYGVTRLKDMEGKMFLGAPIKIYLPLDSAGNPQYPEDWDGDS